MLRTPLDFLAGRSPHAGETFQRIRRFVPVVKHCEERIERDVQRDFRRPLVQHLRGHKVFENVNSIWLGKKHSILRDFQGVYFHFAFFLKIVK
jgi:hypothetical protein